MTAEHPLRAWRMRHDPPMTLRELARTVKSMGRPVTITHLSLIETGHRMPSIELAALLAEITEDEVTMTEFAKGKPYHADERIER